MMLIFVLDLNGWRYRSEPIHGKLTLVMVLIFVVNFHG